MLGTSKVAYIEGPSFVAKKRRFLSQLQHESGDESEEDHHQNNNFQVMSPTYHKLEAMIHTIGVLKKEYLGAR